MRKAVLITASVLVVSFVASTIPQPTNAGVYQPSGSSSLCSSRIESLSGQLVLAMTNTKRLMNLIDYELQSALDASRRGDTKTALKWFYQSATKHIDATFNSAAPELFTSVDTYIKFLSESKECIQSDFIKAISGMDFYSVLERRIHAGVSPEAFRPAWSRAGQILSGKDHQGLIELFKEMKRRIEVVGQRYTAWAKAYREVEPLIRRGTYYSVTERALRQTGKLHPVLATDAAADAARYDFHVFYDVVLAIIREALKVAPEEGTPNKH